MTRKQILAIPIMLLIMVIGGMLALTVTLIMFMPVLIYPPMITPISNRVTGRVTREITKMMFRGHSSSTRKRAA
jgi:hypothetical protein